MNLGPNCPRCGHPVSFWSAQWGRGRAFACKGCGQRLVTPKAPAMAAIGLYGLLYFAGITDRPYGWLLLIALMGLIAIGEYMLLKVRPAADPETFG